MSQTSIEALEVRLAYQDDAINQMSDQLYAQSRELASLTERCRQLEERLQRLAEGDASPTQDETPPHY